RRLAHPRQREASAPHVHLPDDRARSKAAGCCPSRNAASSSARSRAAARERGAEASETRATEETEDACAELRSAKRLREEIIRAARERIHDVSRRRPMRQDEDGDRRTQRIAPHGAHEIERL